MKDSKKTRSIGIFSIITAVLVALKLVGLTDCSWLIVLAPLLLGFVIQIAILLLVLLWIKWDKWRDCRR